MKAPFEIPAINNEFEVLAKFLGIADDNDQERALIEELGNQGGVHTFKFGSEIYSVAHHTVMAGAKTVREFNSNLYGIQQEPAA